MNAGDQYSDAWGRSICRASSLFELLFQGYPPTKLVTEDSDVVRDHNRWCKTFDHPELMFVIPDTTVSVADFHAANQRCWLMPEAHSHTDIRQVIDERCHTDIERQRVAVEMARYEERDLLPMLRFLFFMVTALRDHKIWWGAGRGSSCASYVLFLLGVHKIDAIKYDLKIEEFLR